MIDNCIKHLRYEWQQAHDEGFYVNELYLDCNYVDSGICDNNYVFKLTDKLYSSSQYEAYYEPSEMEHITRECSYNINELEYCDYDLKIRGALKLQQYADDSICFDYIKDTYKLYKNYGPNFTSDQVISHWLDTYAYKNLSASQKVAYANYFKGIDISKLSSTYNPYREWNGGLIDAITLGLINPSDPMKASKMAYVINYPVYTKNGLYGPMYISGLIAQCFVNTDVIEIVKTGMSVIPNGSRLSHSIAEVISAYEKHQSLDVLARSIRKQFDYTSEFGAKHVIVNTMIITACILYAKSFEESIKICRKLGFDVDTNLKIVSTIYGILSYEYINEMMPQDRDDIIDITRELGV